MIARKKGIIKQLTNYGEKHPYVTLALAGTFGYYLYDSMKNGGSILPSSSASYTSSSAPMSDEAFALMMDDIARIDGIYRVSYGANFSSPSLTTDMDQRSARIIKANLDDALNSRATMSSAQVAKLQALNTLVNNAYPGGLNGFRRINGLGVTKLVSQEEEEEEEIAYPHMKVTKLSGGLGMTTSTSTTSSSSHGVPGMLDGSTGEMSMDIDPTKSGLFGVKRNPPAFLKYDQTKQLSGFSPSARRRVGHAKNSSNLGYSPTLDTQFENREAMVMGDLKKHEDILGFSGLTPLAGGDWYE